MYRHGYVYVMEDEPNICKIGYTRRKPDERVFQMSCKFHRDFKLKSYFETENFKEDERLIHELFKEYRIKGEWFNISWEQIKEKSIKIYRFFYEPGMHEKIERFINAAYWHWCEEEKIYITREEVGYDK